MSRPRKKKLQLTNKKIFYNKLPKLYYLLQKILNFREFYTSEWHLLLQKQNFNNYILYKRKNNKIYLSEINKRKMS